MRSKPFGASSRPGVHRAHQHAVLAACVKPRSSGASSRIRRHGAHCKVTVRFRSQGPVADDPFHSLTELAACLARGETTSRAIVEACLARIETRDDKLHAFIEVYRDEARKLAEAADRARKAPMSARTVARDAHRAQGSAGNRRTADHGGIETWLGRISDHTATCVARLLGGRNDSARQDASRRVRVRRLGPQRADGRAVESVGLDDASRGGRIVERLGGRSRGGTRPARSAPIPAARCAFRPRCAASPGSRRRSGS